MRVLLTILGVFSDAQKKGESGNGRGDLETLDLEIRVNMPQSVLIWMMSRDRLHDFALSFTAEMGDWGINFNARLGRDYFVHAVDENIVMNLKSRNPEWGFVKTFFEPIKKADHAAEASVTR